MKKSVLVIDDDPAMLRFVDLTLTEHGYEVFKAQDGQEGLRQMYSHRPDLVILDVQMPRMDGWETCRRIREISDTPIIMLTGKAKVEEDIVRGLDYGADDYIVKPVGAKELVARVGAVMRRADLPPTTKKPISYSDDYLTVDLADQAVLVRGEPVRLTPKEFRLLSYLVENAGRVLTRHQLLETAWSGQWTEEIDPLRIYIWHLRQQIEPNPDMPRYILTETGVGYRFQKAT